VIAALVAGLVLGAAGAVALTQARRPVTRPTAPSLDPLTGVADRRAGEDRIADLAARDAVVMIDIDKFKAVNDGSGHAAGDAVLREFAAAVTRSVRSDDLVARWGGDEFLVVLAGAGDAALAITERLHAAWAGFCDGQTITCSAGVSVHTTGDPLRTVAAADAAMFAAKRAGRARVAAA